MEAILIALHVISGGISLIIGLPAMLAVKGSRLHRQSGTIYFHSMLFTCLSGMILGLHPFNVILFPVATLSLYLVIFGKFFPRLIHSSANQHLRIQLGAFAALSFLVGMLSLVYCSAQFVLHGRGGFLILFLFALGFCLISWADFRLLKNKTISYKQGITGHAARMGGSYIAVFTAFLVNQVNLMPSYITWLLPSIIGSFLIRRALQVFMAKRRPASR
ncbi:MAG: hypothetical protein LPK45_09600 [Bacteroidota bacterium]|nr:hypothetical protein [Bacteroidota bacterium]MDX5431348.1 hypothetical protein [Bacteroidota bacterium]MDX5470076.1 hypothetical protein [Bacteroidota bacterium]